MGRITLGISNRRMRIKRLLDVFGSSLLLAVMSPVFCIIAGLIRLSIGSSVSVIFRQPRLGYLGRPFLLHKFRTMTDERDAQGKLLPDDVRLTRLGRFLRLTSLDELPELINVLKGDMSIVGPRPLLMQYLNRYSPEQMRRHEVKPGITGWAQVNGRNAITWEEKFKLDVWYVDNWSFWLDLKIMAITIWKIIECEGIAQPGHATMEEFFGSDAK
jgi:lipopolysaccharide/colanic/teichoic acid biosynthesis glycosyltransferase